MPRMKRVTVSGVVLEQEIFNVAPNTKNLKGAIPKPLTERTAEEKEKYNLKFLDNAIHRISLIYYDNLIDENNLNIGYDRLRSFACYFECI